MKMPDAVSLRSVVVALMAIAGPVAFGGVTGAGCRGEQLTETHRTTWQDGKKAASVDEIVRVNAVGGKLIQRRIVLTAEPDDAALSLIHIDAEGFATGASFRREGAHGKRYVELKRREDGKHVVFSRGDDETLLLPELPIVVLQALHHLAMPPANAPATVRDVVLLDIEDAVAVPAKLDATGQLTSMSGTPLAVDGAIGGRLERLDAAAGTPAAAHDVAPVLTARPSAPHVAVTDPVLGLHTAREPFVESQTPVIVSWCKQQGAGADPVNAAHAIALAVKPKLAADRAGGPASAQWTLKVGGWDEGGAALVTACLRALEHPARVVTGTVDGAPRTWAQVHDATRWVDVDPLDIDVNGAQHATHIALAEGFPGPLTSGATWIVGAR